MRQEKIHTMFYTAMAVPAFAYESGIWNITKKKYETRAETPEMKSLRSVPGYKRTK
jgi:hypothetical protein